VDTVGTVDLVEHVLYGEEDIYHWPFERRRVFQVEALRDAFAFHYDNCPVFRRVCLTDGLRPDDITTDEDLLRVPLIPSSVFKSLEVRSVPETAVVKLCRSSGTRGRVSRVPRDETSLERFLGSIRISVEQLFDFKPDARIFNLGPDTDEAGDVWFAYVMSLLSLLRPTTDYVVDGRFHAERLLADLETLPRRTQAFIVGPPFLFVALMDVLAQQGRALKLGERPVFLLTAGGWKRASGQEIGREEFLARCRTCLGVEDGRNIRDAYNLVELNTVIFECELGAKHVPPWVKALALNPETLAPKAPGETGLLAFWDALPKGYPGFILTDDFGQVDERDCRCGRSGPTMTFGRRVELAPERGCALALDRRAAMAEGTSARNG
jgi:long-chain-fatty-acid---luciferin-component ligase